MNASPSATPDPARFAELRAEIDRIDATLHEALMRRSAIIDELIVAKGSRASDGAVFRPGRETAMMRALAGRHAGSLPFAVVEHLWRVIIASHTALQQPFKLFVDVSGDPLPSWDAARRFVGFAVDVEPCGSPDLVCDAMAETGAALGLVPLANTGEWWRRLGGDGPRIMARLPIVEGGADAPHFVLSPPLSDPVPFEIPVHRVGMPAGADPKGLDVLTASVRDDGTEEWLVAGEPPSAALDSTECGGYHHPVVPPEPSAPFEDERDREPATAT